MSTAPSAPSAPSVGELGPRSGAEAQLYQRLRAHLGFLRLPDAAAAIMGSAKRSAQVAIPA